MKLDILMATYNGEAYLREQIESILNQTYHDFHLIIHDDQSTDHTLDIIKEYASIDSRISYRVNEQNLGYIKNFESLIMVSNAEYIMLCDQDDVWFKDKVEKSLDYLQKNNLDLIYGDLIVTDQHLNPTKRSFWASEDIKPVKGNCWRSLSVYNVATGCTLLFNRKYLSYVVPFPDQPLIHDWWITFVYAYLGEIGYLKDKLIYYRQHGKNCIGLTNDYYENTQVKVINYLSSINKFMNHRHMIIKRNLNASKHMYEYCKVKFQQDRKLLSYLKKNVLFFEEVRRFKMLYLKRFRLGIYRSRGKIGLLVLIVLNFPILLYILNPIMKLLKKRGK